MANTITFEMSENQAKSFSKLLDEFNNKMQRTNESESEREKEDSKMKTETQFLLSRAREELRKIKEINSNRKKMIWER